MPGVPDPLYVAARRALLDALDALGAHRRALILVGAQAVYCHAGDADLATAPYTTDGDIAIDPSQLGPDPRIEIALMERFPMAAPVRRLGYALLAVNFVFLSACSLIGSYVSLSATARAAAV